MDDQVLVLVLVVARGRSLGAGSCICMPMIVKILQSQSTTRSLNILRTNACTENLSFYLALDVEIPFCARMAWRDV